MPQHKNQKGKGHGNKGHHHGAPAEIVEGQVQQVENVDPGVCCIPTGCPHHDDMINVEEPGQAIRVVCNNDLCPYGIWMHQDCFITWEDTVLAYLRSCGRARSWSEKQRMQNLWTKKGYDLAFKACDCRCGKGHLRKDLDYFPVKTKPKKAPKKKHSSGDLNVKQVVGMTPLVKTTLQPVANTPHHPNHRPALRLRTDSLGSTGSSPPTSADSPPGTPSTPNNGSIPKKKFNFFADTAQAAAGNIFKRRTDLTSFSFLPPSKQNPYHIKMEDEGPHGNDETRCFLLSNLSTFKATEVCCALCTRQLDVFDRYPLIDGTFFLSPQPYNSRIELTVDGRKQFLNSVCMYCLEGACALRCIACRKPWDGSTLLLGTMYSYDIFAATPCCHKRLTCNNCNRRVLDPAHCGYTYYSQFSQNIRCPFCKTNGHHFIKPLNECFYVTRRSIWNH